MPVRVGDLEATPHVDSRDSRQEEPASADSSDPMPLLNRAPRLQVRDPHEQFENQQQSVGKLEQTSPTAVIEAR